MPRRPLAVPTVKVDDLNKLISYFEWLLNPPPIPVPLRNPQLWALVRRDRKQAEQQAWKTPIHVESGESKEFPESLKRIPETSDKELYRRIDVQYTIQERAALRQRRKERAEMLEKLDHLLICLKDEICRLSCMDGVWPWNIGDTWKLYSDAALGMNAFDQIDKVIKDIKRIRAKLGFHQQEVAAKAVRDALRVGAEQVKGDLPGLQAGRAADRLINAGPAAGKRQKAPRWTKNMSKKMKVATVLMYLKTNPDLPDAELARGMKVTVRTLQNWKRDRIIGQAWGAASRAVPPPRGAVDSRKHRIDPIARD